MMTQRISKVLAAAGIASRRKCEQIISAGRVSVNKQPVFLPQTPVDPEIDLIEVDGYKIKNAERKVYFALNKPAGYLCSSKTEQKRGKVVLDLFSRLPYRLFTVGRLDKETTGLLFVTNDGIFSHRVIHPSFNITKEYLAKTREEISDAHLKKLSGGAYVEGSHIKPLKVEKVRRGTVKIVVAEGKKREVRHLLTSAGLTVYELCRIRIGPLLLGSLQPGQWRALTDAEKDAFC